MSNKENTQEEEIKNTEQEAQVEENQEVVVEEPTAEELIQQEKDKYLRLFAEFENYKKRTSKERIELFKTASQELMTSLLPIMDDFDRGLTEIKKVKDKELLKGMQLINDKFKNTLTLKGLTEIESEDDTEFTVKLSHLLKKHVSKGGEIEEALNEYEGMDINDPILIAIRARQTDLKKKAALPKVKKISTKQYYKLMDMESDIIDQMKAAAKEYETLDSEMNQDAGQKGSNWTDADANRYGGDLNKLQTKIENLAKQKAKVKKAIMNYRIN